MRISKVFFEKRFLDKVKLHLTSGNGANGNPKVCGKGGNGGSIFLVGDSKCKLADIVKMYPGYRVQAGNGKTATKQNVVGSHGENVYIKVPKGVDVSFKSGEFIGTINKCDTMLVCRGGEGGGPLNNYMAKSQEVVSILVNLKLIADIGLVGFPNAGKSSFLNKISGASVKIGNYAFTTLSPQVATINYPDQRSITIADLPGIVEGAHVNIGLGFHFLKHVERTKLLLFVIDVYGFKLESKRLHTAYRSPFETILLLNQELEIFNPSLINKPSICLLNKIDKTEGKSIAESIIDTINNDKLSNWMNEEVCPKSMVTFDRIIPISAKTGEGIDEVRSAIRELLDKTALKELDSEESDELNKEFKESMESFI